MACLFTSPSQLLLCFPLFFSVLGSFPGAPPDGVRQKEFKLSGEDQRILGPADFPKNNPTRDLATEGPGIPLPRSTLFPVSPRGGNLRCAQHIEASWDQLGSPQHSTHNLPQET